MKAIKEIVERIDEELKDAQQYAELAVYSKASNDGRYTTYKAMSQDELNHAQQNHSIAVAEIEKVGNVYEAPQEMQDAWKKAHADYTERAAWIKQMLTM